MPEIYAKMKQKNKKGINTMVKITFLGAGSTIFAKNVLGDVMLTEALCDSEIALYDIDEGVLRTAFFL